MLFHFKGYVEHVISTANEWSMAFTQLIVLLTFYPDFKQIHLKKPEIIQKKTQTPVLSIIDSAR